MSNPHKFERHVKKATLYVLPNGEVEVHIELLDGTKNIGAYFPNKYQMAQLKKHGSFELNVQTIADLI